MKFLQISSLYPLFIQTVLPEEKSKGASYDQLIQQIHRSRFGWSDFWLENLRPLGWSGKAVYGNYPLAQKKWWQQQYGPQAAVPAANQILLEQAKRFKPDIILLEDLYLYDVNFRRALREICPGAGLVGWRFAPHRPKDNFELIDVLVTGAKTFADYFRQIGLKSEVVPLAFEPSILQEISAEPRDIPFSFAGSMGSGVKNNVHSTRYSLLMQLLTHTNLQVWAPWRPTSIYAGTRNPWQWLQRCRAQALLKKRLNPPLFGLDYFRLLARSRLAFNVHINVARDFAGNMRMFEATGMGACLITDWKPNINDFFEEDVEIVCYKTAEEAVCKAKELQRHPHEAQRIAGNGQARTLKEHSFVQRAMAMDEIFRQVLAA